jgi:aminomethyltransferase
LAESAASNQTLQRTPLHALHGELGAKLVPFAGYEMPLHYPAGILAEHLATRSGAGLFDVSHMGQATLRGRDHSALAAALEALVPGDIAGLGEGRIRYTVLLNPDGGIVDDLMVTRPAGPANDGRLAIVVNAARKEVDYAELGRRLAAGVEVVPEDGRALLALQGPMAAAVMARHCEVAPGLAFMAASDATFDGLDCRVSRSGYTGEDGFEISVGAGDAEAVARALLAEAEVTPVGLGARDSLRLEAGLCLYGHDIDETTSPVEAGLAFTVAPRRRARGGFAGAARILAELADGPARRRVGILPQGRAPAREGTRIRRPGGAAIGTVTSGGFGPSLGGPVAMGYVEAAHAAVGTPVELIVRDVPRPGQVAGLPFVPHRYRTRPAGA